MNAGDPHSGSKVWKAPDRKIGKPGIAGVRNRDPDVSVWTGAASK
jgi:hypothetical protein